MHWVWALHMYVHVLNYIHELRFLKLAFQQMQYMYVSYFTEKWNAELIENFGLNFQLLIPEHLCDDILININFLLLWKYNMQLLTSAGK